MTIQAFAAALVAKYGYPDEKALLFPTATIASRCIDFLIDKSVVGPSNDPNLEISSKLVRGKDVRLVELIFQDETAIVPNSSSLQAIICAVIFPGKYSDIAQSYWQHSGEGVSSRRAEFHFKAFEEGHLIPRNSLKEQNDASPATRKGPRRYQREELLNSHQSENLDPSINSSAPNSQRSPEGRGYVQFVEERFGRNLDLAMAAKAKLAIRRRIAGSLTANVDLQTALETHSDTDIHREVKGFSEDDVYLFPAGMSSIHNVHRTLLAIKGSLKSVCFGFPYLDTLKTLEKWGPGCLFYGHGVAFDLDDLESRCKRSEKFQALWCEFPGNPLLKTPDLRRIRSLADEYDFALVVDETIANSVNVNVLPFADVLVSSLTKIFSGDANVMGGSVVLNPRGRYYRQFKEKFAEEYEDNLWPEDAVYIERNSRDYISRCLRINNNAEVICQVLITSRLVKDLYYPKFNSTRHFYDAHRNPNGGYGMTETDITSSPYALLAHYKELEWAEQYGVDRYLIRFSVGLEGPEELASMLQQALTELETQ
ncbi:MAG: hypothetical protein MMC33_006925 [Icmadophila ericetorum]|nr:hypothetical protein [Icmadophila ericetorum]